MYALLIGIGCDLLLYLHAEPAATRPISLSPSLNKMPTLRSATLLASSWPCHRCSHSNDSSRNKKRCSSCRAWRDGLAPLSAKGGGTSTSGAAASGAGLVDNDASCRDENGPPNNLSNEEQGRDEEKVSLKRFRWHGIASAATANATGSPIDVQHHTSSTTVGV